MRSLSKSQYVRGRQCVKSLWLYRHRKDLAGPIDEFQQSIFDKGTEFGKLAMQRFPGGVLIEQGHDDPEGALKATADAMGAGARVIYEAAILHEDVLIRADIMVRSGVDDRSGHPVALWDLYEVKSSTKVTEVYIHDVAIQLHTLRGAGLTIGRAFVMHANSGYVRRGELDLHQLFAIEEVTELVREALLEVPGWLAHMKKNADTPEPLAVGIGEHCSKPYGCDFREHCWAHVPKYSVFNIAYLKMDKKLEFFNKGIQRVDQVNPDIHILTAGQVAQVTAARAGRALINVPAIRKFLGTLTYPLAFLDFETDNPVVPPYDGLRPYSQMPFQAVLCVQDEPGGVVVEHGYLGDGLTDPRDGLIDFLLTKIPHTGSILAYHKSFEAGRIEELAQEPSARPLLGALERLLDLADPFRTNAYTHPDFRGRWSIKAVLPVLVPSMTYKGLEIGDGAAAMAAYAKLRDPKLPAAERARITHALKVYCGQDVVAMVKILEHLYDVAAGKIPAGVA
jgi:hypothetical protein